MAIMISKDLTEIPKLSEVDKLLARQLLCTIDMARNQDHAVLLNLKHGSNTILEQVIGKFFRDNDIEKYIVASPIGPDWVTLSIRSRMNTHRVQL